MPKHRGLNLTKFVAAVDQQLLDQYFVQFVGEEELPPRILMNCELVDQFLNDPANALVKGLVREDFQRINDLATAGKSTLVWVYKRYGIDWEANETPANMAIRLYLHRPDEFKHAYAWYQWYNSPSRMSVYSMPADEFELTPDRLGAFKEDVSEWFRGLAKGATTDIRCYEDDEATVILVTHGSYIRTVAQWDGDEVHIHSFRPATEDILLYDPVSGVLRIKATLEKERTYYVEAFAGSVLEDVSTAQEAQQTPAFSLEPFQTDQFDFGGNQEITKVELLEAKIQLAGSTEPRIHLKSSDLTRTLRGELEGFSLAMGQLKYVKLRFHLRIGKEESKQTVEIAPPERSDLPSANHQEVISRYLQEQGVKLI